MHHDISSHGRESGVVIIALFVLIIIGIVIAAFLFVMQKQRESDGKNTQIKIESTINLWAYVFLIGIRQAHFYPGFVI